MISINPYEIVMQIVNFSVLFFLLKRFLFKPLVEFLDSREAQIQGALDDAKQSKASAEQLLQDQEAALKESRLEMREMRKQAERSIQEEREAVFSKTRQDIESRLRDSQKEVNQQIAKAKKQILDFSGKLSVTIAEKVTQETLSDEQHGAVVNRYLAKANQE
ncbi:ATP synthase F0 subunit B [bacterium]|nr:ATP synthase F0 subunit B [bacterium]